MDDDKYSMIYFDFDDYISTFMHIHWYSLYIMPVSYIKCMYVDMIPVAKDSISPLRTEHHTSATSAGVAKMSQPAMHCWLVVGPPLWKIWKSIGMISNPIYGKIKLMFQTTNQIGSCPSFHPFPLNLPRPALCAAAPRFARTLRRTPAAELWKTGGLSSRTLVLIWYVYCSNSNNKTKNKSNWNNGILFTCNNDNDIYDNDNEHDNDNESEIMYSW